MSRLLMNLCIIVCALTLSGGMASGDCGPNSPSAMLTVDSTTYSGFTMSGTANGCTISGIFGSFATTGYTVTIRAFTMADPVIDFGMNFAGSLDPNVSLKISVPYTEATSAPPFIMTTSFGSLIDSDRNGSASVTPQSGSDIQTVKVNGTAILPELPMNPGCSFSGQPAGFTQNCPAPTSRSVFGSFPGTGTLELDLAFILSAGDSYNVGGTVNLAPEPATNVLLAAGLVALIGLARRHSQ